MAQSAAISAGGGRSNCSTVAFPILKLELPENVCLSVGDDGVDDCVIVWDISGIRHNNRAITKETAAQNKQ